MLISYSATLDDVRHAMEALLGGKSRQIGDSTSDIPDAALVACEQQGAQHAPPMEALLGVVSGQSDSNPLADVLHGAAGARSGPAEPQRAADVVRRDLGALAGVPKSGETSEDQPGNSDLVGAKAPHYPDRSGLVAEPDTAARARTLHLRRELAAAVEHGTDLLAALGLPPSNALTAGNCRTIRHSPGLGPHRGKPFPTRSVRGTRHDGHR